MLSRCQAVSSTIPKYLSLLVNNQTLGYNLEPSKYSGEPTHQHGVDQMSFLTPHRLCCLIYSQVHICSVTKFSVSCLVNPDPTPSDSTHSQGLCQLRLPPPHEYWSMLTSAMTYLPFYQDFAPVIIHLHAAVFQFLDLVPSFGTSVAKWV